MSAPVHAGGVYHLKCGLYFARLPGGRVTITRHAEPGEGGEDWETVCTPSEWASAVAAVSIGGESSKSFGAALELHGVEPGWPGE